MQRINVLDKYELGEIIELQVASVADKGYILISLNEEEEGEYFLAFTRTEQEFRKYEFVYVAVDTDNRGKRIITTRLDKVVPKYSTEAQGLQRGDTFTGRVYNVTDFGAFVISDAKVIGLIHNDDINTPLRIGNKVEGRVTFVREDGRVNFSLRPIKEVGRVTDSEKILTFLQGRKGMMPYSDDSSPELIKDKFGISKSAFKRALGKLYKDGVIEQKEGWTYLKTK